jgi:predicted O-methyltransferase YrrM
MVATLRAQAVLNRLYNLDKKQFRSMITHYMPSLLWQRITGRKNSELNMDFLRDKLVALDAEKAYFCYLQCRVLKARRIVEVGTSFGVSTIYLAAAVRDNSTEPKGVVIGTEIESAKAKEVRANWLEAGVSEYIELREGDALETLRDCGGPIDFVLMDTWISLARPALELLVPQLSIGAVVVCDNVRLFEREYSHYLTTFATRLLDFHQPHFPSKAAWSSQSGAAAANHNLLFGCTYSATN